MKPLRLLLSTSGATAALALLLLPTQTEAFSTLGAFLPLQSQRDVRVYNNFTDAAANDNTTPDPNWPGYTGAPLAIWKACAEWSSRLHGDGSGDSHQPGGVGSGGANFDITWQGLASSVGVFDNVHSELSGGNGGIYAFMERFFGGNSWSIRYYQEPWVWDDGPGSLPGGRVDLQGIATHEYGHSLGLGHTGAAGATMRASTSQSNSINLRSINGDDIAGVQFVYGVASPTKPVITSIDQPSPIFLDILGSNFDPTNNEVWFTQAGTGGTGLALKLHNQPSSNGGTLISVIVPFTAGPGDVLVRIPGSDHDDLSNAWPFDPSAVPFDKFCNAAGGALATCPCGNAGADDSGCDNSAGTGGVFADVTFFNPSVSNAVITTTGYPPAGQPTVILIRSSSVDPAPYTAFGDGVRCIGIGDLARLGTEIALNGTAVGPFGHNYPLLGGGAFYYQSWYRNTGAFCTSSQFNLSSGVEIVWPPAP